MFARKVLHCAAPALSFAWLVPSTFFHRAGNLPIRHLLMQEAGDFQRPARQSFSISATHLHVEDDAIVRMPIVDVLEELEFKVLEADAANRHW